MRVAVSRVVTRCHECERGVGPQLRNEHVEVRAGVEEHVVVDEHHKLGPRTRHQRVAPGGQTLSASGSVSIRLATAA